MGATFTGDAQFVGVFIGASADAGSASPVSPSPLSSSTQISGKTVDISAGTVVEVINQSATRLSTASPNPIVGASYGAASASLSSGETYAPAWSDFTTTPQVGQLCVVIYTAISGLSASETVSRWTKATGAVGHPGKNAGESAHFLWGTKVVTSADLAETHVSLGASTSGSGVVLVCAAGIESVWSAAHIALTNSASGTGNGSGLTIYVGSASTGADQSLIFLDYLPA